MVTGEPQMSRDPSESLDSGAGLANHRTSLASFRTQLALDRTTLAWIRTALTMASFGFGMVAFFRSLRESAPGEEAARMHQGAVRFGVALIVLGLVATLLAGVSHWFTLRRLRRGERPIMRQLPLSITVAMLLAVMCLAGLWALFEH
jgi:putative membrane protein